MTLLTTRGDAEIIDEKIPILIETTLEYCKDQFLEILGPVCWPESQATGQISATNY